MAIYRVKHIANDLLITRRVARVSYLISAHNLVTRYIIGLNPDGTRSVKFTKRKSESTKSDPEDVGKTYVIEHLKIGEGKHDLDESE